MEFINRRLKRKAIRKYGLKLNDTIINYINTVKTLKYANRFVEDEYTQSWHIQKTTKIKNSYKKSGIILIKQIGEFELRLGVDYEKYLHYFNICHKIYLQIIDKLKDNVTYSLDYEKYQILCKAQTSRVVKPKGLDEYQIRIRMPGFVLFITDKIKLITRSYEDVVISSFYSKYTCKRWVNHETIISLGELTRLYPDCFKQFIETKSAKF